MNRKVTYCIINLIAMSSLIFSGCNIIPEKSPKVVYDKPVFNKTIAVEQIQEMREKQNYFNMDASLLLIPLWLYKTTIIYEAPEYNKNIELAKSKYYEFDKYRYYILPREISKEIYSSIKYSNIFSNVKKPYSNLSINTDYILQCDLISTLYTQIETFYGISILILPFMIAGSPLAINKRYLSIKFTLIDNKTKVVIWEHKFTDYLRFYASVKERKSSYRRISQESSKQIYDYLINQIMIQVIPEIKAAIEKKGVKPIE